MSQKNPWLALIAILAVVYLGTSFFAESTTFAEGEEGRSSSWLNAEKRPSGGDFTLQGPDGPVSLSDYRGKVVLLFFGYTFCPVICPTSLSNIAQALAELTSEERDLVQGIFISVDPERDTADVLRVYAPFFHPRIIGLTGTQDQIRDVARLYGTRYVKQKPDSDGLYSVDHSALTYIIGRDGGLVTGMPNGTSPRILVERIRALPNAVKH